MLTFSKNSEWQAKEPEVPEEVLSFFFRITLSDQNHPLCLGYFFCSCLCCNDDYETWFLSQRYFLFNQLQWNESGRDHPQWLSFCATGFPWPSNQRGQVGSEISLEELCMLTEVRIHTHMIQHRFLPKLVYIHVHWTKTIDLDKLQRPNLRSHCKCGLLWEIDSKDGRIIKVLSVYHR